jgi:hypothetical protein
MAHIISPHDIDLSSSLFWSHGDNILTSNLVTKKPFYTKERLKALLNLYALFSEHLCILDICLLNNESLRKLIMYDGYNLLLSNSIIVPMLRSSIGSFYELEYKNRVDSQAYVRRNKNIVQPYADFLDEQSSAILITPQNYFDEVLTENYENSLLNSDFLRNSDLSHLEHELKDFMQRHFSKGKTLELRRSAFFFFAEALLKAGRTQDAARVKLLSSAVYNNTFTFPLNLRPAFPNNYVAALRRIVEPSLLQSASAPKFREMELLDEVPLSPADVSALTPDILLNLRKTREAKIYFEEIQKAAQMGEAETASKQHSEALITYSRMLATEIALIGTGRRPRRDSKQRRLQVVRWGGFLGGIVIGIGSRVLTPGDATGLVLGLLWSFGSFFSQPYLREKVQREERLASEQWWRMKESLNKKRPVISTAQKHGEDTNLLS